MSIPVFREGKWIYYTVPEDATFSWNANQKFQAASFYATALTKNMSPSQSAILTECYINTLVYPGLQYNEILQKQIQTLFI